MQAHHLSSLRRVMVLMAVATFAVIALAACGGGGGGDSDAPGASPAELRDEVDGKWLITQQDRVYTLEDLLAAGWKKSKQLETDTLANSIDAWYGFFQQKDIELRFYESHEAAVEHGVGPADELIGRGKVGRAAVGITVLTVDYGAYAIAGNVVMMCESELAPCETLIDALE